MPALDGKKALILGGSRGIGAAIVERLARDGADTAFTYGGSADAATALAGKTGTVAIQSDSADRVAVGKVVADRGPLDILVINAGIAVLGDPLEQDPDDIDRMIDINVRGPYHAAVDGAREMPDGGRIVIVGSVNGDRMPFPGGAAYALTKSAVQGMVRGLARDFGDRGDHREQRPARPGRYDPQPGRRADEGPHAFVHGDPAPCPARRDRRNGSLPGRPRSRDRHRCPALDRRRLRRLGRDRRGGAGGGRLARLDRAGPAYPDPQARRALAHRRKNAARAKAGSRRCLRLRGRRR